MIGDMEKAIDAGYWWSVTEYDADNAWYRGMCYNGIYGHVLSNSKKAGFSVRCLKKLNYQKKGIRVALMGYRVYSIHPG
jgi:hypothetical protein